MTETNSSTQRNVLPFVEAQKLSESSKGETDTMAQRVPEKVDFSVFAIFVAESFILAPNGHDEWIPDRKLNPGPFSPSRYDLLFGTSKSWNRRFRGFRRHSKPKPSRVLAFRGEFGGQTTAV